MFKLVIQDDEGKTTVVPLIREEVTIGRKEGNTIRLTERNVSRRHARILRQNGSLTIEDLDSYNGIRVNGSRIEQRADIKESDRVQIGDYLIELRAEAAEAANSEKPTERLNRDEVLAAAPDVDTVAMPQLERPDTALDPQQDGAERGRLVILSKTFAGRELVLDRAEMVIGRTEDNDISINHRSISRHHAKVIERDGHYSIVDLGSSNGVRVNDEDYGEVELRRGDLVDLGHIRLRFVEPGESFVFGRDAQAVDTERGERRSGGLWLALAALAIIAGVVAMVVLREGGEGGEPSSEEQPVIAAVTADAAPIAVVDLSLDAAPASTEVADHIAAAEAAIAGKKWDQAVSDAAAALAIDPQNPRANELRTTAEAEKQNQERYATLMAAARTRDYAGVAQTFSTISADSVYRPEAQKVHDRLRDRYEVAKARSARRLARRGNCSAQEKLAREASALWPEMGDRLMRYECRRRVVTNTDPGGETGNDTNNTNGTSQETGNNTVTEPEPKPSVEELVAQCVEEGTASRWKRALRVCEAVLDSSPGNVQAHTNAAIAACKLGREKAAKRHHQRLPAQTQGLIAQVCSGEGISLE